MYSAGQPVKELYIADNRRPRQKNFDEMPVMVKKPQMQIF